MTINYASYNKQYNIAQESFFVWNEFTLKNAPLLGLSGVMAFLLAG